jgi:ABC-type branched-subunit amino acid transport system ATPase component
VTVATVPPGAADPDRRQEEPPAIRTRGLTKRFGSILAIDGLDLDVPAGSVFGLLGPNGAGKTTTIRILTGLAQRTSGQAEVAGIAVGLDRPELRRRLGYLDQDPRFYSWMKGRELLELVGAAQAGQGRPQSRRPMRFPQLAGRVPSGSGSWWSCPRHLGRAGRRSIPAARRGRADRGPGCRRIAS